MKRLGLGVIAAAWLGAALPAAAVTVTIACAAVGIEHRLCREGAEAWAGRTGNRVEVVATPNSATERLALFQQLLAAGSADIDVFQIDIVWPGLLGRFLIDLDPLIDDAALARHIPEIVAAYRVDGRLVAVPWYADAGLLYARRDLLEKYRLEPPETWAALAGAAQAVVAAQRRAGNTRLVGYVFQGKAYEGLTCNALEWIASYGAPPMATADGRIALAGPRAVEAVNTAAGWIGGIAPRGVLTYGEEEARGVFQSGLAVFMRNWPYAWALVEGPDSPVRGKVAVGPLPRGGEGGRHASTLGGGGLAVSRFSAHPEAAADLVRDLTGPAEQRRRALIGAFNPTIAALYRDAALNRAQPVLGPLRRALAGAVARPSRVAGERYNRVSAAFWSAVHRTLSGSGDAASNLRAAERRLGRR